MLMLINGHEIYLEVTEPALTPGPSPIPGEGSVILLHHGLGAAASWQGQVSTLAQAGWRVIVYDRWGYGASDPRPALDLPEFGADLADLETLLAELQVKRPLLVGHSDGGTLALIYAAAHPEAVAALVTVAAHIYIEPKMGPGIDSVHRAYQSSERMRRGLQRLHGEKTEAMFYHWYNGWRQEHNLSWDLRPRLAALRCPTLVVQGLQDEHATPQHARDLAAAIPGAQLWLVEGAAHMLPQENAAIFNPRLLEFLSSNLKAGQASPTLLERSDV